MASSSWRPRSGSTTTTAICSARTALRRPSMARRLEVQAVARDLAVVEVYVALRPTHLSEPLPFPAARERAEQLANGDPVYDHTKDRQDPALAVARFNVGRRGWAL